MYEELVKQLRAHNGWALNKTLDEAADAIEDLEFACNRYEKDYKDLRAYLPKWIPAKERLPEEDGDYLTLSRSYVGGKPLTEILGYSENLESVSRVDFEGVNRNGWYDYDSEVGFFDVETVTHWMPLPEPPKEEENVSTD